MKLDSLKKAFEDPETILVAQIAPAIRVSIGELFGYAPGKSFESKLPSALRKAGFKYVFDTSFGADVAVMEETKEMEERLKKGGKFPIINSCCPGTVSFLEHSYPDLVENMATVKSPMEITSVLIKTYFAEKMDINPDKIFSVALMPCVIKKAEAIRPELKLDGKQMTDLVLTTKELAELFKEEGIDISNCEESSFDSLLGTASSAGKLFGSTGGISEAALRNFAHQIGVPLEKIDSSKIRSFEGTRELKFQAGGMDLNVLIINSLRNASPVLNDRELLKKYHFVEIMACLGGCVGGAGQPPSTKEILEKRRAGLFEIDHGAKVTVSSENPEIKKLYADFLGHPLSEKSVRLLHTKFQKICSDCY